MNLFERWLSRWVALCIVAGVLIEVPLMLVAVRIVNRSKGWYEAGLVR